MSGFGRCTLPLTLVLSEKSCAFYIAVENQNVCCACLANFADSNLTFSSTLVPYNAPSFHTIHNTYSEISVMYGFLCEISTKNKTGSILVSFVTFIELKRFFFIYCENLIKLGWKQRYWIDLFEKFSVFSDIPTWSLCTYIFLIANINGYRNTRHTITIEQKTIHILNICTTQFAAFAVLRFNCIIARSRAVDKRPHNTIHI